MESSENIKVIVVLLEFNDGTVRQVLTTKSKKEIALKFLTDDNGNLMVGPEIEPIEFIEVK